MTHQTIATLHRKLDKVKDKKLSLWDFRKQGSRNPKFQRYENDDIKELEHKLETLVKKKELLLENKDQDTKMYEQIYKEIRRENHGLKGKINDKERHIRYNMVRLRNLKSGLGKNVSV